MPLSVELETVQPYATSPAELGKFIVNYTELWGKVIRDANIKPE